MNRNDSQRVYAAGECRAVAGAEEVGEPKGRPVSSEEGNHEFEGFPPSPVRRQQAAQERCRTSLSKGWLQAWASAPR